MHNIRILIFLLVIVISCIVIAGAQLWEALLNIVFMAVQDMFGLMLLAITLFFQCAITLIVLGLLGLLFLYTPYRVVRWVFEPKPGIAKRMWPSIDYE